MAFSSFSAKEQDLLDVSLNSFGPSNKSCVSQLNSEHILKGSESNYDWNQFNLQMQMLRNHEGLHAPIKLAMEIQSAKKVGRLPFLPSSNVQLDILTGRDEMIGFSDFLGVEENFEYLRQPHAVVEKSLGIL